MNQVKVFTYQPGVFYEQSSEICRADHGIMPITLEFVNGARWSGLPVFISHLSALFYIEDFPRIHIIAGRWERSKIPLALEGDSSNSSNLINSSLPLPPLPPKGGGRGEVAKKLVYKYKYFKSLKANPLPPSLEGGKEGKPKYM